jgi:CubicO group peptidase (beta-lactamase class C family)
LLIVKEGQTIFHSSFGFKDRENKTAWRNHTLSNIRSMTKPITSVAAQILIDRGKLELDAPIAEYLNSFQNHKDAQKITVRQVLTHRSGLPLTNLAKPDQFSSLQEQVSAAGKDGPQFKPGSKYWYSDTGTDVIAAVVEHISGELIHQFVQREIFEPLGMTQTLYGIQGFEPKLKDAASLYARNAKSWVKFWAPGKALYPFAWGSQTVYSTTSDYAKFLGLFLNNGRVGDQQLISKEAVSRMLEPVSKMKMLGSDAPYPTGFRGMEVHYGQMMVTHHSTDGVQTSPVIFGHSGSDGTNAWVWPEKDLMILYFTQSRGGVTALRIEEHIDSLLIHPGKTLADDIPVELRPYLGQYIANSGPFDNEEVTILTKNGKLVLDVPSQLAFELMEPDEYGFWPFAIAPRQTKLKFEQNERDEVVALYLHQGRNVIEIPRKGSPRVQEIAKQKMATQAAKAEQKAKEKFIEAWVGNLDLGTMKPLMQFIVVKQPSGKMTAYFDSITEGRTDFDAKVSIKDKQIKFEVPQIKLTYMGKINDAGDAAKGTWSQGGRTFPLTLKKQDKAVN